MSLRPANFDDAKSRYKPMRRSTMVNKGSGLKRKSGMKRSNKRLRPGPKTKAWDKARAALKVDHVAMGITTCEFQYPGCWHDDALSFAHSRKRSDPLFDINEVAVACTPVCHHKLDVEMSHAEMLEAVKGVIWRRKIQP
jgi:hypothetical protein